MFNVLIVEDNYRTVKILAQALEEKGYQVDKAYDGEEAIAKLKQRKYNFVSLDLKLPRIGGEEVLRFIRTTPELADTYVIIVSSVTGLKSPEEQQLFQQTQQIYQQDKNHSWGIVKQPLTAFLPNRTIREVVSHIETIARMQGKEPDNQDKP